MHGWVQTVQLHVPHHSHEILNLIAYTLVLVITMVSCVIVLLFNIIMYL